MKQITPEIKAKIFALYWRQNIWGRDSINLHNVREVELSENYGWLMVKSLSSITDEDAIEVLKLLGLYKNYSYTISVKDFVLGVFKKVIKFEVADYLRSKGYALPAFGYSVDQLVEIGVFKLKG